MLESPMLEAMTKHSKKLFHDAEEAGSSVTLWFCCPLLALWCPQSSSRALFQPLLESQRLLSTRLLSTRGRDQLTVLQRQATLRTP